MASVSGSQRIILVVTYMYIPVEAEYFEGEIHSW